MSLSLTSSPAWLALKQHCAAIKETKMLEMFAADPERAGRFSLEAAGLFLDYSKNRITDETLRLLCGLVTQQGVTAARDRMFAGEPINVTENRPVLHTALRYQGAGEVLVAGRDVMPMVRAELDRMEHFSTAVRCGEWKGFTGQIIYDVVSIGIGGSDLGPQMATEALIPYAEEGGPRLHFVSNVDGAQIKETLAHLDPATTMFVVVSKTFTTQETLMNARTARKWLLDALGNEGAIARHFAAVTANPRSAVDFGINANSVFGFWDWVGGRYSLWSAVGLSIALAIGMKGFREMLAGAALMDEHFRTAPPSKNMPMIMAMLGVWYGNFWQAGMQAILPYSHHLRRFPAYLQQLDMESNGKSVDLQGHAVDYATGQVLFGEPGTNGQHSFYQLLHQGTHLIPADFIGVVNECEELNDHQEALLANLLAQPEALLRGKSSASAAADGMRGTSSAEALSLVPYRTFEGNRPSNLILLDRLDPARLGALIALYEHKVFVQGIIWNINSFDQWGVELGKVLAKDTLKDITSDEVGASSHDSSTVADITKVRALRGV